MIAPAREPRVIQSARCTIHHNFPPIISPLAPTSRFSILMTWSSSLSTGYRTSERAWVHLVLAFDDQRFLRDPLLDRLDRRGPNLLRLSCLPQSRSASLPTHQPYEVHAHADLYRSMNILQDWTFLFGSCPRSFGKAYRSNECFLNCSPVRNCDSSPESGPHFPI